MRSFATLLVTLCLALGLHAAGAAEKAPALAFPIAEVKLTNGTVFRNVTVVRYDRDLVVLKSAAGTGSLSYNMIPEPTRGLMMKERDAALAAKATAARETRETVAKAEAMVAEASAKKAADAEATRARVEEAIRNRTLIVGMTPEQAMRSWGAPGRKNSRGGSGGSTEQWVYETPQGTHYVYFDDGKLSSWSTQERRR